VQVFLFQIVPAYTHLSRPEWRHKMHVTPESLPRLSPEEYLEWENQHETRHELVDGYLYAMTVGSLRHDEIAMNVASALHVHFSGGPCRVYKGDINVDVANNFNYPDLLVRCDDSGSSKNEFSISDPKVIVEVLSPSTQRFDGGEKRLAYLQNPTLTDYVLIFQDSQDVEINKTTGTLQ